jgi:hypothetical protein
MKRIFYGLLGLACGVMAVHYFSRWQQIRETSSCLGNNSCISLTQHGGDTKSDRTRTIALFGLAAFFVWMASSHTHDGHNH